MKRRRNLPLPVALLAAGLAMTPAFLSASDEDLTVYDFRSDSISTESCSVVERSPSPFELIEIRRCRVPLAPGEQLRRLVVYYRTEGVPGYVTSSAEVRAFEARYGGERLTSLPRAPVVWEPFRYSVDLAGTVSAKHDGGCVASDGTNTITAAQSPKAFTCSSAAQNHANDFYVEIKTTLRSNRPIADEIKKGQSDYLPLVPLIVYELPR
jgi:hypothetical protein